jgi:Ca2+-binding RTX toxin-like protein
VAFTSKADDLVATDTNCEEDVFVRDLQSGTTTLASVNKDGIDSGSDSSSNPVISADGRFVAFVSSADDLVATDTNDKKDVFVRDLQSGNTTLVSVNKYGTDSGSCTSCSSWVACGSRNPVISANGQFVAFESVANDLVATDTNDAWDVFAFDVSEPSQVCHCTDSSAIQGASGPDFLYGTEQADIICGFGANDFIAGMGGNDCINGGGGNDWIYGGGGDDGLFGGAGKDVIYGSRGNDVIYGGDDEDYLFGGAGDDKLDGGEGFDWIFCGNGMDKGIGEWTNRGQTTVLM